MTVDVSDRGEIVVIASRTFTLGEEGSLLQFHEGQEMSKIQGIEAPPSEGLEEET